MCSYPLLPGNFFALPTMVCTTSTGLCYSAYYNLPEYLQKVMIVLVASLHSGLPIWIHLLIRSSGNEHPPPASSWIFSECLQEPDSSHQPTGSKDLSPLGERSYQGKAIKTNTDYSEPCSQEVWGCGPKPKFWALWFQPHRWFIFTFIPSYGFSYCYNRT